LWIVLEVSGNAYDHVAQDIGQGIDGLGNKSYIPSSGWIFNQRSNSPRNWLIRGFAEAHPGHINRSRSLLGYDIFRFVVDDIDNINDWIEIAIGHPDTFFIDDTVQNYVSENYQYAIFARYSGDNVSIPVYSSVVKYEKKVSDEATSVPLVTGLIGNHPNPFNPETVIQFVVGENISSTSLVDTTPRQSVTDTPLQRGITRGDWIALSQAPRNDKITIEIFNIKGQKVKTLVDNIFAPGTYSVVWDGTDDNDREVGSGIYFYRMQTDEYTSTRKMVLIK
jgi:hypothetical protein